MAESHPRKILWSEVIALTPGAASNPDHPIVLALNRLEQSETGQNLFVRLQENQKAISEEFGTKKPSEDSLIEAARTAGGKLYIHVSAPTSDTQKMSLLERQSRVQGAAYSPAFHIVVIDIDRLSQMHFMPIEYPDGRQEPEKPNLLFTLTHEIAHGVDRDMMRKALHSNHDQSNALACSEELAIGIENNLRSELNPGGERGRRYTYVDIGKVLDLIKANLGRSKEAGGHMYDMQLNEVASAIRLNYGCTPLSREKALEQARDLLLSAGITEPPAEATTALPGPTAKQSPERLRH